MEQRHVQSTMAQLLAVRVQIQPEMLDAAIEQLSMVHQHAAVLQPGGRELQIEGNIHVNCQQCQELLPSLIEETEMHSVLSSAMHTSVMAHLASCSHCLAEYAMLRDLDTLIGTPAVHFPEPDLSFLAPAWIPARGWMYQLWRQGHQVARMVLRPGEGTPLVSPTPLAVKSTRHVRQSQKQIVQQVTLTPDDIDDLDVEAVVWQSPEDALHYMLTVRVQVPSRWPDLAGTGVHAAAAEWQAEGTTDTEGMVQFKGLPAVFLNRLTITVSP